MKFAQNNHPTFLFGPTCLFGTWEWEGLKSPKMCWRNIGMVLKVVIIVFVIKYVFTVKHVLDQDDLLRFGKNGVIYKFDHVGGVGKWSTYVLTRPSS